MTLDVKKINRSEKKKKLLSTHSGYRISDVFKNVKLSEQVKTLLKLHFFIVKSIVLISATISSHSFVTPHPLLHLHAKDDPLMERELRDTSDC